MMDLPDSPLHLKPLYKSGTFIGYKLRSKEHEENDEWIRDIIDRKNSAYVEIKNKSLILKNPEKRNEVFTKDCCFLCENIFFAEGKGLDIDEDIVNILKKRQPNKTDIDSYNIFGKTKNGNANGLPGRWLEIKDSEVEKLIEIIKEKTNKIKKLEKNVNKYQRYKRCKC